MASQEWRLRSHIQPRKLLLAPGQSSAGRCHVTMFTDVHTHTHMVQVGSTALHVATLRQHPDIIKSLRFHHADSYSENKVRYIHVTYACCVVIFSGRGGGEKEWLLPFVQTHCLS